MKKLSSEVPAAQAMQYTTERALEAIKWLKETQIEFQKRRKAGKDCSKLQLRKRILADTISMYVSTLVETGGSGHSLPKSYDPHQFIDKFVALPIVKECLMNRHNRSAHESKSYGHFVSPDELLKSPLEAWLSEVSFFVCVVGRQK